MWVDRWMRRVALRIRSIVLGSRVELEMDEELRFHVDQQIDANIRAGMSERDARDAAMRAFGGLDQRREEMRDARRVSWLIDAVRDGRHALRLLSRNPAFAVAAVLSLGIGIGANAAMFSVVDALLLKKLPVPQPDGLWQFHIMTERPYRRDDLVSGIFERIRANASSFSMIAGSRPIERANVSVDRPPSDTASGGLTRIGLVTADYFATLGVEAAIGRVIGRGDDFGRPVVVVSDAFWRSRMNGDADLRMHTLHMSDNVFDVVGVMPPGFSGEVVGSPVDLWLPFSQVQQAVPEVTSGTGGFTLRAFARLAPGVSVDEAAAATLPILRQGMVEDAARFGVKLNADLVAQAELNLVNMSRGISPHRGSFRQSLLMLMAFVGLLVVIGCANVANLLLARSSVRQRELAVRLAVGAGRGRIARQLLAESAIIAGLGGIVGLALAVWAIGVLSSLLAAAPVSLNSDANGIVLALRIDPRVLAFTTLLCGIAAGLSGLAPAMLAQRLAPAAALRSARALGLGRFAGPSSALLVAQVAVSVVLLIGAGLFMRSLHNLRAQDLGLGRDNHLLVWLAPGQTGRQGESMVELWTTMLQRLSAIPGVVGAGASNQAVLNGGETGTGVPAVIMTVVGEPPKQTAAGAGRVFVTPGFFAAAGARVIAGREFTDRDAGAAVNVTILSASMARFYFGSEAAAVGRMVTFPGPARQRQPHEVVGVVRDFVRTTPRHQYDQFSNFFPYRHVEAINPGQQSRLRVMLIAVKTAGDPLAMVDAVRRELRAIDPLLPVLQINTPDQQLDGVLAQDRIVATLSTALGAIAMVLASLGLFGLLSYRVARRTNEIGVRLAMGATRESVLTMVMAESGRLVLYGIVTGVIAAVLLSRLVASRLHGVSPTDPWTICGAAVVLGTVALVAALLPARQASAVDPSTALRAD